MKRALKISIVGGGAVLLLSVAFLYMLFHGYFDPGQFEIKQYQLSSRNEVAMLAERSDQRALGGPEYYVLIGDHLFTATELRHAYYGNAVVFNAASNCLALHWDSPNELTIRCNGSNIDRNHINSQRLRFGNIAISYENIAIK